MPGPALDLSLALDVRSVPPGTTQRAHLVIEVSAALPEDERHERPPLALVFAIDVSASMWGQPMEQVVRSIERMVELLDPTDRVGIVSFSEGAEIVAELEQLDAPARRRLAGSLRRIDPEGGTDMESGLRTSRSALGPRVPAERRGILLLSDGDPTLGDRRPEALAEIAATFRSDATVSTLGYGEEHNEDILRRIAVAGGGQYYYVRDPALCATELALAVGATGDAVAEGVSVDVSPARGVDIIRIAGDVRVRKTMGAARVELPDLQPGEHASLIVEVAIEPGASANGPFEVVRARLAHRRPGASDVHVLERAIGAFVQDGVPERDPSARARVLVALAEEARTAARVLADQSSFELAAALLRRAVDGMRAEADLLGFGAQDAEGDPEPRAWNDEDGTPLGETIAQLAEEAEVLAKKPNPAAYRLFRKAQAGRAAAASRRAGASQAGPLSRRAMATIAGNLPRARLLVVQGNGPNDGYRLEGTTITIGQTNHAQIRLEGKDVAREHCSIVGQDGRFWLTDLGGGSGTLVNGKKITAPAALKPGDVIGVGEFELKYEEER
ncbi:VWA domain-containing protein [Polyangium jinanense]|uniref:VWA domain-containing protein n=1 Tax=Polyangium jinanense TaxID=2829994 RepID=A0A9X3X318_9BACT|nr:VWA domain-containing protein [Polyangium jinanense]MDC3952897.1 VWA domain-containing protein [Polyangium jinanense]MDC3980516.1 VWA domain-containing protein [Polyangium jinanense]